MSQEIEVKREIFRAEKLEPGDRVLLCTDRDDYDAESIQHVLDTLRERFPGVEFTMIAGITGVVVNKKESEDV